MFSLSFDDFIWKNVQMIHFRRVYNQFDSVAMIEKSEAESKVQ